MSIPIQYLELESLYASTLARGIRSLAVTSAWPFMMPPGGATRIRSGRAPGKMEKDAQAGLIIS